MSPSRDKSVARPKRRKIYEYISKSRSRAEVIPGEFTSVRPPFSSFKPRNSDLFNSIDTN